MIFFGYQVINYELGIGAYGDESIENGWLCFLKAYRKRNWNRLFGKKAEIAPEIVNLVDRIMRDDEDIDNIRWYYENDWMNGEIEKYNNCPND